VTFLLLARLIKTKGVPEFVEAARRIRRVHGNVRFQLLGPLDPNPAAVKRSELDAWIAENAVEYLGVADDVRPFIANAHAVVLPSYYGEGIPRALLEDSQWQSDCDDGCTRLSGDSPGRREWTMRPVSRRRRTYHSTTASRKCAPTAGCHGSGQPPAG